jgi:hypothetical protein
MLPTPKRNPSAATIKQYVAPSKQTKIKQTTPAQRDFIIGLLLAL